METRDLVLEKFRGEPLGNQNQNSLPEELFQNKTLRPILKFQNDLFIEVIKNHIVKQKVDFINYPIDKKLAYFEHVIKNEIKFRNSLKGIVIGLFTIEEYNYYIQNSSSLNKRMMNMLIERIKSQIQLFEVL